MLKRTKKLLSGLLTISMLISSAGAFAAEGDTEIDYSIYANKLAEWNAEGTKTCTNNNLSVDIVEDAAGAPEGSHYYRINNYPSAWQKLYNFDTDAVEFVKDDVYHISFWVKQELPEGVTGNLWKGLGVVISDNNDIILANDEDFFRYGGTGYQYLDQTNEWQYKSIIYKHSKDNITKTLRIRGDGGASNNVNLYLDDISIRRVPNPDKYVTAAGQTMFQNSASQASSLIRFHNSSYNSNAKTWAEDLISSQITLNSASASAERITLVFNDIIGAELGECGVDTVLIKKGLKGAAITGDIVTTVDKAVGTTTVVIPCRMTDDTLPVEISGLKDLWGKTVADIKIPSVQQGLAKGNMIKNAYFESTDFWSIMSSSGATIGINTQEKVQGNASLSLRNLKHGEWPLKQVLDVERLDETEVMQLSAWTRSSTAGSRLRLKIRINQKEPVDGSTFFDVAITDSGTDFVNAEANEWVKREFVFRFGDKISEADRAKYHNAENVAGYEVYLQQLASDSEGAPILVDEFNMDNIFLGYYEPIATTLSGAFYGEDNSLTLAFTSNKATTEPAVTADTIDESKIILEYYNGRGKALSEKMSAQPTVTQEGTKTFVKYPLISGAISSTNANSVFAVFVDGITNASGVTVASKMYDVFKNADDFMVCYQTSGLDESNGTASWTSSQLLAEMYNKEINDIMGLKTTTTAVMVILYNASDKAVEPMGTFAFYDENGFLKKTIIRKYKELAPGEIYDAGTDESARFQFTSEEKKISEINMLWWDADTYEALNKVTNIDKNV